MPYAVWLDMSTTEATGNDEAARAQLPGLGSAIISNGHL
jgi:hypothetical protein